MPIYEYLCPDCSCKFELRRSFSDADKGAPCPKCKASARKLLSTFCATSRDASGESTSIAGAGSGCSSCSAPSCTSCGMGG